MPKSRHRVWIAFIALFGGASLGWLGGAAVGEWAARRVFLEAAARDLESMRQSLDRISRDQRTIGDALAGAGAPDCSIQGLDGARRVLARNTYLSDILIIQDGRLTCSVTFGPINPAREIPDVAMTTYLGVDHHEIEWPLQSGVAAIAARRGPFLFLYNHAALSRTETDDFTLVLLDEEKRARSFLGRELPKDADAIRSGEAFIHDGILSLSRCATPFATCIVRSMPLSELQAAARPYVTASAAFGAVLGGLGAFFGCCFLMAAPSPEACARRLLKRGQVHFRYQPIVSLVDGRLVAVELLVRPNPRYADVSVAVIVHEAERTGLSKGLLRLAIRDGAETFAARARSNAFGISVNATPHDLSDPGLVGFLETIRKEHALPADALALEITERQAVKGGATHDVIADLHQRGYRIAIDDFGSGYSNLGYLGSLDVTTVKIDREFISAAGTESAREKVLDHVIAIARSLDLRIVAEGVETAAQAAYVQARGVEHAQGFYFAPPMTGAEFNAWADAYDGSQKMEETAAARAAAGIVPANAA